jgi:DNA-binding response OmpR family regulator
MGKGKPMVPSARRVLLVDEGAADDAAAVEIANALQTAGFTVRIADADDSPDEVAARFRPDVAVISVTPKTGPAHESVGAVVHRLRSHHGLPVVVLECQPEPAPFAPPIASRLDDGRPADLPHERLTDTPVVARVAAVLRDTPSSSPTLEAGDLVVDEAGRLALRADEPLDLTRLEFDLLAYFVRNRNRVQTREALLAAVWRNEPVTPNAIEAVVSKLRIKLEAHGPRLIHTVRGVGYVLRVAGTSPFDLRRHSLMAERERLVRQRDEVLARREEVRRVRREAEAGTSPDAPPARPVNRPRITPRREPPAPPA